MAGERIFKRGRIWYGWFYEGGERVQRSTKCTDRRAAETVVRDWERAAADPDHAAAHGALMREALALVLAASSEKAETGRGSSETTAYYARKVGHLSRIFEPDERPFRLAALRPRHVDDYVTQRRREGTSDATIAKELGALGRALRLAKRAGLWRGDIDEIMPPDFGSAYVPRERWLTLDEVQRLLAQLVDDRAARVAFIVATSARWGESDRAERDDVQPWLVLLRGSKTADSWRRTPLVLDVQGELLAFALERAQGTAPRLFRAWPNARRDLIAACERAKIEPCSPNDLRRTFAHWMRQEGVAPDLVGPAMGHVDTRMVERVYGRLRGAELAAAMLRAVAHLQQPRRIPPASSASADSRGPDFSGDLVPRDGIEPPTRGFSSHVRPLLVSKKDRRSAPRHEAGVADLQQRPRLRAVKGGRS
jgi:integrase